MKAQRQAERTPKPGDPAHFTGLVWLASMIDPEAPSDMNVAEVTFEPGARTHWHSHAGGQTLLPVSGRGRIRADGGALLRMQAGDSIWIPPGERHWHGADPDSIFVQLSITLGPDGTTWDDEAVSDADYLDSDSVPDAQA